MKPIVWVVIIVISLAAWWSVSTEKPRADPAAPAAEPARELERTAPAPAVGVQSITERMDANWARTDSIVRWTLTDCYRRTKSMAFCREEFKKEMLKECEKEGRRADCLEGFKLYCENPRADRDFCERD
jgi:hypothetical protein